MKIIKTITLVFLFAFNAYADEIDPIQVKYKECMQIMESQPPMQVIPCFESVLKMDSKSINTMYYLGKLYAQNKQYDKAVKYFEKRLKIPARGIAHEKLDRQRQIDIDHDQKA